MKKTARTASLTWSLGGALVAGGAALLSGLAAFNGGPRPIADLAFAGSVAACLLLLAQNGATLAAMAIERDHRRTRQQVVDRRRRDEARIRSDPAFRSRRHRAPQTHSKSTPRRHAEDRDHTGRPRPRNQEAAEPAGQA